LSIPLVETFYTLSSSVFCPVSLHQYEALQNDEPHLAKNIRIYKLEYLWKELQVVCPVMKNKQGKTGVVLSAVKLPFRRYPSHVYLYAILLCLLGVSMRKSAIASGAFFGIAHFSHSTVSRCFKRLEEKCELLLEWNFEGFDETPPLNELPAAKASIYRLMPALPGSLAMQLPKRWLEHKRAFCEKLFVLLLPLFHSPKKGNTLVFAFWKRFSKFLL